MTKAEIQQKIDNHWANIEECDIIIDRLASYGASWAFDCREMRIAESSKSHSYRQIEVLRAKLQTA